MYLCLNRNLNSSLSIHLDFGGESSSSSLSKEESCRDEKKKKSKNGLALDQSIVCRTVDIEYEPNGWMDDGGDGIGL